MTNAKPNDLFTGSAIDAIGPTSAQLAAGQSTRVIVFGNPGGSITQGALYESYDAGTAPLDSNNYVTDSWSSIPTDPTFGSVNIVSVGRQGVIAYGGSNGGFDDPDVIYAASGSKIYLRTTAGGTLTATTAQPTGAGKILAIALDPTDWRIAYVTDGTRVWETTNAGGIWTDITGNLRNSGSVGTFAQLVVPTSGTLLFGGDQGVSYMLSSAPGLWNQYGSGLPNVAINAMVYNAADNLVVVGTVGRGAWEIQPTTTPIAFMNDSTLEVVGFGNAANNIGFHLSGGTYTVTDTNSSGSQTLTFASGPVQLISFDLGSGVNAVTYGGGNLASMVQGDLNLGTGGGNSLTVDDSSYNNVATYTIDYQSNSQCMYRTNSALIYYSGAQNIALVAGTNIDTIDVVNTAPDTTTYLNGTGGELGVDIGMGSTAGIMGRVNIRESSGATDIVVDDSTESIPRGAILSTTAGFGAITALTPAEVDYLYADTSSLEIHLGTGANPVDVEATGTPTTFIGGVARGFGAQAGTAATLSGVDIVNSNSGGITNSGFLNVDDCTITGNSASHNGGGIQNLSGGTINLVDCLVSGNSSSGSGGGVYNQGAISISNCTFSENSATSGAGVYNAGGGTVQAYNSILWGDSGAEISNHGTASVQHSDVQGGWTGTGSYNLNANPQFTSSSNFQLLSTSPCINTGNNNTVVAGLPDLAGNPRIANGIVDMGAYEFQGMLSAPVLVFAPGPTTVNVGAFFNPTIAVDITRNGQIVTNDNSTVTLSIASGPAGGLLNGSSSITVNASAGIATFNNISLNEVGIYSLRVTDGSDTPAQSAGFDVNNPGVVPQLVFTAQPSNVVAGSAMSPSVVVQELISGVLDTPDSSTYVTLSIGGNPVQTSKVNQGVATFSNLILSNAGTFNLVAGDANDTQATSNSFTVTQPTPPPPRLVFGPQPTTPAVGSALNPAITVTEEDSSGNPVVSDNSSYVTLGVSGGTLSGSLTAQVSNGVATFNGLSPNATGTYTLAAIDGNDTAGSLSFTVASTELVFTQEPQSFTMGSNVPVPTFQVSVEQNGSVVTNDNSLIGVTILVPNGASWVNGQVHAVNGVATFSNFFIGSLSEEYYITLQATDLSNSSIASGESNSFSVNPGPPTVLNVTGGGTTSVGSSISPGFQFQFSGVGLDYLANDSSSVTASIFSGPDGGTLSGTLTEPENVGFNNLVINNVAGDYTLQFTDTTYGISTQAHVTIIGGEATHLVFLQQPGTTTIGSPIQPSIEVEAEDNFNNLASGYNGMVTLSVATPAGTPLSGIVSLNAQNGLATFGGVSIGQLGTFRLSAVDSLTSSIAGTSNLFSVIAPITYYVDQHADAGGNGLSPSTAFTSIQSALSAAIAGDTIDVAQGDYSPESNATDTFQLKDGVTLQGGFQTGFAGSPNPTAYPTLLDGMGTNMHVVTANGTDSTAVLDGFTITGDNAVPPGSGQPDDLYGAGLLADGGAPTILNCTFTGNVAYYGGAVFIANETSATAIITNCVFQNNTGSLDGGAVYTHLSNSTFVNCLFTGNSTNYDGGAIYDDSSSLTITNCTFTANHAIYNGSAINNAATGGVASSLTITNSIFWNDINGGGPNFEIDDDNNNYGGLPTVSYCDISNLSALQSGDRANLGFGNIDADPMFVNPSGQNYQLQESSPCINSGNDSAPGLTGVGLDLTGNLRNIDGVVDMGAYEAQLVAVSWTGLGDGINWSDPSNWSDTLVPTQFDDVTIGSGFGTIQVGAGAYAVHTLMAASPVELTAGILALYGSSTFSAGVTIDRGAQLNVIQSDPILLTVTSLNINPGGTLDLADNEMLINYGADADPLATIASYVANGYNGGGWNGPGIVSTAAQVPTNGSVYGLGYADGKDGVVAGLSSGQIEVKYTLLGNANLDGLVNAADFTILAANFNQPVTGWDQGDFNYDGLVNAADFTDLAANFNQGVTLPAAAITASVAAPAAASTIATVAVSNTPTVTAASTTKSKLTTTAALTVGSTTPTVAAVTTKSTAAAPTALKKTKPVSVSKTVAKDTTNTKPKATAVTVGAARVVTVPSTGLAATSQKIKDKDAKFLADR
ncbi:MAG: choice-of-anchor Q domain-containing protein [Tepidisphaeraceae bacterium]